MIAIILALFVCNAAAHPTAGVDSRIIGGQIASDEQFPYQVSLRYYKTSEHFCGASIVSDKWVLSTANCVHLLLKADIIVVVGTNYLNSGGSSHSVDSVRLHPDYIHGGKSNDIALLRVQDSIALNSGAKIIPLAEYATQAGLNGIFSGWGFTTLPSIFHPNDMHYIALRTITLNECKSYLDEFFPVTLSNVCTLVPSGQGLCTGDSGGPLVINGEQHGISIWGVPCGKGYPDVFTSVSFYRSWIKKVAEV